MDAEYKAIYDELIKFRLDNPLPEDVYTEAHHIKPASMCRFSKRFGERIDYEWDVDADDKDNVVRLLPSEHFKAHYYLWKTYRAPKTAAALRLMLNMKRLDLSGVDLDIVASEYEQMRIDMRSAIMVGAIKNIDKLIEGGIASNTERISNGTHNFI